MIAVSVVSHGHGGMVGRLVAQLLACPEVCRIVVTLNIPESMPLGDDPRIQIIVNPVQKGFGANHNAAFRHVREPLYCVLNPDIDLDGNPFAPLVACLRDTPAALVAPLIRAPDGQPEDNARYFPTPLALLAKALTGYDGRHVARQAEGAMSVEWVAGMFMLFRADAFRLLEGFDESYFLYYEDVDLCARAWKAGMKVLLCPKAAAFHDARRESHRNVKHLSWHLASMGRYLLRHWGRLPRMD